VCAHFRERHLFAAAEYARRRVAGRLAEVEIEDRLSQILMDPLHAGGDLIDPACVSAHALAREQIHRVPARGVLLDEARMPQRMIDRRQRPRRRRARLHLIERFEQHHGVGCPLDTVRIVGEQAHPLRHVARNELHQLAAVVVRLRLGLQPFDHGLARAEVTRHQTHERGGRELARNGRQLREASDVVDRLDDHANPPSTMPPPPTDPRPLSAWATIGPKVVSICMIWSGRMPGSDGAGAAMAG
jgi:hypothetical protein